MDPQTLAALISVPAAIAVIVTVNLFLKHDENTAKRVAAEREKDRAEREANRLMFENHLSGTVRVLERLDGKIDRVLDAADR